ncbi:hypothetical protein JCM11251_000892 [Rhodosporidiobolus azoricus]
MQSANPQQAAMYAQQLAQQQQRAQAQAAAAAQAHGRGAPPQGPPQLQQIQAATVRAQQALQAAQQQGNHQAAQQAAHQLQQLRALHAQTLQAAAASASQQPGGGPAAAAPGVGGGGAAQPVAGAVAQPAGAAATAAATGISSRERDLGDGDDALRNAKRRKPTSRLLPLSFAPPTASSQTASSPSDTRLSPSLASLDSLAASYKQLQEIERRVDWTVARKKVEVGEAVQGSGGGGKGRQLKRTLRVHLTATLKNQPWQLSPDELLAAAADVPPVDSSSGAKDGADISVEGGAAQVKLEGADEVKKEHAGEGEKEGELKVPSVQIRVTGEVLNDPTYSHSFSHYLQRLVLESPPAILGAPSAPPSSNPVSWTRPPPPQQPSSTGPSLPASFTSTTPTTSSTTLPTRLTLYLSHPAGDRFALVPELAHALDLSESDRVGVLEALWAYARERGLVVGPEEGAAAQPGGPKGGIRTDARLAKFFGGQALVPYHLLPEYINRCLAPAQPRVIDVQVDLSSGAATEQHFAFDLDLYVPSPLTATLSAVNRSLSSLTSNSSSPDASSEARELAALDDKLALNCLSTSHHLQQLHLLLAFARDPAGFLAEFVDAQAGSLAEVLGSSASGLGKEGGKWREELRNSVSLSAGGWAEEAARVLAMRSTEGKSAALKNQAVQQAQQAQQHAQVAQMQQQQMLAAAAAQQQQQQQQAMVAAQQGYGRR